MRWRDVADRRAAQLRHQRVVLQLRVKLRARAWQQAGHADRGDGRQLRIGRLQLDRPVLGQQLLQRHAQLVAQRVHHQVGHLAPALLQAIRHQAIEHVGIGQPSRRRPAGRLEVLHEHALHLLGQAPIAGARLADDLVHQAVRVEEVAGRLLELTLQPVRLAQAAQVEVDQLILGARVVRQLALEVFAGLHRLSRPAPAPTAPGSRPCPATPSSCGGPAPGAWRRYRRQRCP